MAGRWAERIITPGCGAVTQTLRATPSHRVRSSSAPRSPRSVRFTAASPGSRTERASPRTRGPVDLVIGRLPVALLPLIETSGHARTGGGDRTDLVDAVHGPYGAISDAPQPRSRRRAAAWGRAGTRFSEAQGTRGQHRGAERLHPHRWRRFRSHSAGTHYYIAARGSRRRRNNELRRQPQITLAGQHLEGSMERTVPR